MTSRLADAITHDAPPATAPGKALAHADALAAAGDPLSAIAYLTRCNHEAPHPGFMSRLVTLRHEAFDRLERRPGHDSWPPPAPPVFDDVDGIPEIEASELSAETLAGGVLGHGALIVRGLVDRDGAERLADDVEMAFEQSKAGMVDEVPAKETAPWYVPFRPGPQYNLGWGRRFVINGGGLWTVDSPQLMFEVVDLFHEVGLDHVLTEYLGERPAMSVKKGTLRRVPVDSGSDWHQDGAFLGEGIRTMNVWLTLTHCGDTAPGLDIVARRLPDIVETGTEGAVFDWSVGQPVVDRVAQGAIVRPIFEPGDAVLFDERNLHRTAVSEGMVNPRYAIETWFFAPSAYPVDQIPVVF